MPSYCFGWSSVINGLTYLKGYFITGVCIVYMYILLLILVIIK